jgi:hypothetical protein
VSWLRHRLPYLASVAIAAVAIAGCGGNKSGEPQPTVEEQVGLDTPEGLMELQSRVEGRIRDCMKAQGFQYVPVDPFAQRQALTGKGRMTDEEFTKQFGYGITTLFGRGTQQSDPNDRTRKSLSATDRAAYDRALWGDNPGATFQESADTGDFSELGGCTKDATDATFGGAGVLTALVGKLDELDQRIVQDQRMVKATESWSACMADKGYRYGESDEINDDFLKRFRAIVGPAARPMLTGLPDPGTSYDRAALGELQSEEVKVVNADVECEKREITLVEHVVRQQYEEDFRQQNRDLLTQVPAVGR